MSDFKKKYIKYKKKYLELKGGLDEDYVYIFLGGLPKKINLWNDYFKDAEYDKIKIIVHPKDNPMDENGTFTTHNIPVKFMKDENHLRTKWAGLSLVGAALMMMQYGIINYNVKNFIFLPGDSLPLYNHNELKEILDQYNESIFCYPFSQDTGFVDVKKSLEIEKTKYKFNRFIDKPFCSQWFILNKRDFPTYFHMKTLNEGKKTYIKNTSKYDIINEDILSLNKSESGRFPEDFWYYEYLKNFQNKNKIRYLEHFKGGAYDENFFCNPLIDKNSKKLDINQDKFKKITRAYIDSKKLLESNFYKNFNDETLYKIIFKNKENDKIYNINTFHYNLEKISKTSCSVSVFHYLNTIDVTSKLKSLWINNFKINLLDRTDKYYFINELINDILNTNYTKNKKTHYLTILNKINTWYVFIKNKKFNNYLINPQNLENNGNFSKFGAFNISKRDHPLLFIIETFGMILCAYNLIALIKYINIINGKNNLDNLELMETTTDETIENFRYLNSWNTIIVNNLIKNKIMVKKFDFFPNKKNNIGMNDKIMEKIMVLSKKLLDYDEIYEEYFLTLPNFTNNYLEDSIKNSSFFIRKIAIENNIKYDELPDNHLIKLLITIQEKTNKNLILNNKDNPLNELIEKYDFTILQNSNYKNFNDIKDNILVNYDNTPLLDKSNISKYIKPYLNNSNYIKFDMFQNYLFLRKKDILFKPIDDFINNVVFDADNRINLLKIIVKTFEPILEEYNKMYKLDNPIKLVMKGGFLTYNLLLEIFNSFGDRINNILLEKYKNNIYSFDLDFSVKLYPDGLSKEVYNFHYNNIKKILIFASFKINEFISKTINIKISQNKIEKLFNTLKMNMMNNAWYRNSELIGLIIPNIGGYKIKGFDYYTKFGIISDLDLGVINLKESPNQIKIDSNLINKILGINYNDYKFGTLFSDSYDWIACNNQDMRIINSVLNLYIPVKLIFYNNYKKIIETKIYTEAIVDIAIDDYQSYEYKLGYKKTKYEYVGENISYYGYDFKTLIKVIQVILFSYCVKEKTLTVQNSKYKKRSKLLSLLYCIDIIMFVKKNYELQPELPSLLNLFIDNLNHIKQQLNTSIKNKNIEELNIDIRLLNSENLAIYDIFKIINRTFNNIVFEYEKNGKRIVNDFNNFYYFLNTLIKELEFFQNNIINNLDMSDSIYINDFFKYRNL